MTVIEIMGKVKGQNNSIVDQTKKKFDEEECGLIAIKWTTMGSTAGSTNTSWQRLSRRTFTNTPMHKHTH